MNALARFQRDLAAKLRDPAADSGGGREVQQLAIYRANLAANRRSALAATYPVVHRLVGGAFFGELARRYGERWPSRSGDLHLFGSELPVFIEGYEHARGLAYLPDVARLEWARHEALHAAEAAPLAAARIATLTVQRWEALHAVLHPSVRLVESPHPIAALVEANAPERDGTPTRTRGPDRVLVWRRQGALRMRRLGMARWALVAALARGASLGEALAAMGARGAKDFAAELTRLGAEGALVDLIAEGALVDLIAEGALVDLIAAPGGASRA